MHITAKISCKLIFAAAAAQRRAFAINSILVCVYLVVNRIISEEATRAADNHISVYSCFFLCVGVCARGFRQSICILLFEPVLWLHYRALFPLEEQRPQISSDLTSE